MIRAVSPSPFYTPLQRATDDGITAGIVCLAVSYGAEYYFRSPQIFFIFDFDWQEKRHWTTMHLR